MQFGPYLHPATGMSGVWPLRILISSSLGFRWFIVCMMAAISATPSLVRCMPTAHRSTHRLNLMKSSLLLVLSGYRSKNGMMDLGEIIPASDDVMPQVFFVVV